MKFKELIEKLQSFECPDAEIVDATYLDDYAIEGMKVKEFIEDLQSFGCPEYEVAEVLFYAENLEAKALGLKKLFFYPLKYWDVDLKRTYVVISPFYEEPSKEEFIKEQLDDLFSKLQAPSLFLDEQGDMYYVAKFDGHFVKCYPMSGGRFEKFKVGEWKTISGILKEQLKRRKQK